LRDQDIAGFGAKIGTIRDITTYLSNGVFQVPNSGEESLMSDQHSNGPRPQRMVPGLSLLIAIALFATAAMAQNNDIYIYPAKGQNQAQQDRDRYECHAWAVNQTGFDPSKPAAQSAVPAAPAPNTYPPNAYQPTQRHVLRGSVRGAALGAVGGAIAGDAGKGAAAGAAMGGMAGGFRRLDQRRQQYAQQQYAPQQYAQQRSASSQSGQQSQRAAYYRAMGACLQGRGYAVN
jgi:OmpA family protein